jgi:glutaredoxin
MNNQRFIIIGRSSCPFCAMAEDLLSCKGIQSIFLDYELNQHILEDYKDFYNQKTVPIIILNNTDTGLIRKVGGYTDLLEHVGE